MIVIGIDPGSHGGVAISYPQNPSRILCTPIQTNSDGDLMDFLLDARHISATKKCGLHVYIERVTGFIGGVNMGAHMFTFGRSYEYAFGLCHALKIQLMKVEPAAWQKHFNCPPKLKYKERKQWAINEARVRLPEAHRLIADTADAALLCSYGRSLSG